MSILHFASAIIAFIITISQPDLLSYGISYIYCILPAEKTVTPFENAGIIDVFKKYWKESLSYGVNGMITLVQ